MLVWGSSNAQRTPRKWNTGLHGALKVVGDTANEEIEETAEVTYELMCRKHWHAGLKRRQGEQLELLDQQDEQAEIINLPVQTPTS